MTENSDILWEVREANRVCDLEERTYRFALAVRRFVKKLPGTITNNMDIKQLVRASGSVGANYIEANESSGKKDFLMRIRLVGKKQKRAFIG